MASSGAGWPQKLFVQTPGQVSLLSARLVTSTSPLSRKTWHENARCRGVSVVWTVALSAVPMRNPSPESNTTSSGAECMPASLAHPDGKESSVQERRARQVAAVLDEFFSNAGRRAHHHGPAYVRLWRDLQESTSGGKWVRPQLVMATYEGLGGADPAVAYVGAAF